MRIALISPYDWCVKGGVNNHVAHLARVYREWGHDVTIFAPASWPDSVAGECYVFGATWTLPVGGSKVRISFSWMSPKAKRLLAERDFDIMHAHEPLLPMVPYHLFRYVDEQAFRFNERKDDDQGRFFKAIAGIIGRRLRYSALIGQDRDCQTPTGPWQAA